MGRDTRTGAVVRGLAWLAAFAAAGISLLRLGESPGMRIDWSDPVGWLTVSPPEVAVAALGRLTALALLGWVALSTIVYLLARLAGVRTGSMTWLSIGPIRRMVDTVLAGYLVLGTMGPVGAVVESHQPPPTQQAVDPLYVPTPAGWGESPTATDAEERTVEAPTETGDNHVVVAPGDHLWSIAANRLEEALGREPTDDEVFPYWSEVVEANRSRLRSGDPDLIFPDERVVLPPVSPES